jgi:hypothetical protein
MPPLELLIPPLVVALAFAGYCLVDLSRAERTRFLPKWAWAVICVISVPTGGLVYLLIGRSDAHAAL